MVSKDGGSDEDNKQSTTLHERPAAKPEINNSPSTAEVFPNEQSGHEWTTRSKLFGDG